MDIKGIVPIIAATFYDDGSIDFDSLRSQLRYMKDVGCDGATLFGIAGEYYKLTDSECEALIKVTVEECKRLGLASIVSCTPHSTCAAIERAKLIEESGADCMMLLPPFFLKPAGKELFDHIRAVAGSVSIPVMLQYAPEQTGVSIAPETLRQLAQELPNMTYFKIECKPAGPYITSFLNGAPDGVRVFAGNAGYQMLETLDRGAVGVMPGASMVKLYIDIYRAYMKGDKAEAVELHNRLLPILNHIRQNVEEIIHYEKAIMARRGVIASGYCRHPSFAADEEMDRLFDMYYEQVEKYL